MTTDTASLDADQKGAWESFLRHDNVAVVGPAGCGKSRVLMPCILDARRRYGERAVLVMSWTWVAAQLIGGRTYHSFLGITPHELSKQRVLQSIMGKARIRSVLQQSRVVVIEEAPTFRSRHFIQLDFVLRNLSAVHMQGRPWGGRQVLSAFWG